MPAPAAQGGAPKWAGLARCQPLARRSAMQKLQEAAKKRALGEQAADPATPQRVSLVQLRIPGNAAPPTPRRGFLPTTRAEKSCRT